jgi:hypothetical protein
MVIAELHAAGSAIESGAIYSNRGILHHGQECSCDFATKWMLPCKHQFIADSENGYLTEERLGDIVSTFEECGMEVYEKRGWVLVPSEKTEVSEFAFRFLF